MRGRTALRLGLGLLWLIDALLQAQPAMFTSAFVQTVLQPAIEHQPVWLAALMHFGRTAWIWQPALVNAVAVVAQLVIGLLLLFGRDSVWSRAGLWVSIAWGFGIWVFGEGLGGILAGSASALVGAPGSVLLYMLGAVLLLMPARWWEAGSVGWWSMRAVGVFWLAMAAAQAWPSTGYWTGKQLSAMFSAMAALPQPGVLAAPIQAMAAAATTIPVICNAGFVAVMLILGLAFATGSVLRSTYALSGVWLLFIWWLGQDFGGLFSGSATDPNTALPLALFLLAVAWSASPRFQLAGSNGQRTVQPAPPDHQR